MGPRHVPVLIAGAGPAGLAAAAELAHHGVRCLVVEPRREVSTDRPRAKTTSIRTMEHFRRWGVADAVRAAAPLAPTWSDRVVFCDALTGHEITHFVRCFGLGYARDGRFAEGGQQIPQPLMERVLREHVAARPEVELMLGARVESLTHDERGVSAEVVRDDGRTVPVFADYALGSDGANGAVRRSLGVHYVGRSDHRPNFNLVFRAPELSTSLGNAVQYWVVGDRPGVVGRLDLDGTWWAIAPGVDAATGRAQATEILEGLVGRPFDHQVVSTDPWTARMLVAERFSDGRVSLVGEAAHLNPPWGGHGYNTCVGDAVNIAWKLAAVLQGWGGPALLDSYEAERRPIAADTIHTAETNMSALANDLAAQAHHGGEVLSATIQRDKRAEFHSLGLVLGYSYAGSPVVQPGAAAAIPDPFDYHPSTHPGSRLPHAWLDQNTSFYDVLGPGLTLVGPVDRAGDDVAELVQDAAGLGLPLTVVPAPDRYPWGGEFMLVRPDQHIAARAGSPRALDLRMAAGYPSDQASTRPSR